jgi:RimJ/RimL family protein N-acetyltransferase
MTPHLADTPVLVTERLTLRAPALQDAEAFVAFYQSDRSIHVGGPMMPRVAWNFFCTEIGHWAMHGFGMFTVTRTGEDTALGVVGHWYPLGWPEREVGWLLMEEAEGQGIAQEAADACVRHAYGPLGWDTLVSYVDPANTRSIALAERLGARLDRNATPPTRANTDAPQSLVYRHPRPEAVQ